jgi:hypothetical protein
MYKQSSLGNNGNIFRFTREDCDFMRKAYLIKMTASFVLGADI